MGDTRPAARVCRMENVASLEPSAGGRNGRSRLPPPTDTERNGSNAEDSRVKARHHPAGRRPGRAMDQQPNALLRSKMVQGLRQEIRSSKGLLLNVDVIARRVKPANKAPVRAWMATVGGPARNNNERTLSSRPLPAARSASTPMGRETSAERRMQNNTNHQCNVGEAHRGLPPWPPTGDFAKRNVLHA